MEDLFKFEDFFGGIMGITLDDSLKKYASMKGYKFTVAWNKPDKNAPERFTVEDAKHFLSDSDLTDEQLSDFAARTNTIISMLEADIPVTMSIGPGKTAVFMQDGMEIPVTAHFYIVGGMHIDYDNATITLDIHSWGENYTVDYIDYTLEVYTGAESFSSYILIKNKG